MACAVASSIAQQQIEAADVMHKWELGSEDEGAQHRFIR